MDRVTQLREQTALLRTLAASFDIPNIRAQLLDLATRCEALAAEIEAEHRAALQKPIDPRQLPSA
jgi:hypothetical protein